MPLNCFCVGRRVYSSNTVSAVPERVCLGPSRLRVGGPAKDVGLISLEYHEGLDGSPRNPLPPSFPHPRTFSIFMEHDITLSFSFSFSLPANRATRIFWRSSRSFSINFYEGHSLAFGYFRTGFRFHLSYFDIGRGLEFLGIKWNFWQGNNFEVFDRGFFLFSKVKKKKEIGSDSILKFWNIYI